MLSKISAALVGLVGLASATAIPSTLTISVVNSNGTTLGTLNGFGNFSSPGPSFPFRGFPTTGDGSTLSGYEYCSVGCFLSCSTDGSSEPGEPGQFTELDNGNLALVGTDGTWSVNNTTDAAGGKDPFGHLYGIPVYLGDGAAIPVTLVVRAASG